MSTWNGARVGVIMGGASGEHEVSLSTGSAVADALAARGHDVARVVLPASRGTMDMLRTLETAAIDVAFIALHGRLGEDGCVQGMLELANIPYTGAGVLGSALAMDKVKSKELFLLHNVPTPPYYTVSIEEGTDDLESIHRHFGFPVIVKPRGEGSSLAVTHARNLSELARGLSMVFEYDDHAVVERFIAGAEVNVGILNGRVLGAIEICPRGGLYDYEAKYTPGATEYHMPARLQPARYQNVLNIASRAAESVSATGAVRVDLLVTPGDNEYVLEVNTLPGMTSTSLLPKIAESAGYGFSDLCEAILEGARLHTPQRQEHAGIRQSTMIQRPPRRRKAAPLAKKTA